MMIKVINEKEEEKKLWQNFLFVFVLMIQKRSVCVWMDSIFNFFVCCCVSIMNVHQPFYWRFHDDNDNGNGDGDGGMIMIMMKTLELIFSLPLAPCLDGWWRWWWSKVLIILWFQRNKIQILFCLFFFFNFNHEWEILFWFWILIFMNFFLIFQRCSSMIMCLCLIVVVEIIYYFEFFLFRKKWDQVQLCSNPKKQSMYIIPSPYFPNKIMNWKWWWWYWIFTNVFPNIINK